MKVVRRITEAVVHALETLSNSAFIVRLRCFFSDRVAGRQPVLSTSADFEKVPGATRNTANFAQALSASVRSYFDNAPAANWNVVSFLRDLFIALRRGTNIFALASLFLFGYPSISAGEPWMTDRSKDRVKNFWDALSARPSPSGPFVGKRPPFSPEEFWNKLLKILRERDGYVTKERFEEVFGVRFTRTRVVSEQSLVYGIDYGKDWYFEVGLSSLYLGKESGIDIRWYLDTFGNLYNELGYRNTGVCIETKKANQDIVDSGWLLSSQDPQYSGEHGYTKNNSHLVLIFSGDCVHSIKFTGTRP